MLSTSCTRDRGATSTRKMCHLTPSTLIITFFIQPSIISLATKDILSLSSLIEIIIPYLPQIKKLFVISSPRDPGHNGAHLI